MYILLALIAACTLGIGVHFLLPGRGLRGVAVTPAIATATAAAVYTVLQWSGVGEDSVWQWVSSLGGAVALAVLATVVLTALRTRSDAAAKQALGI